MIDISNGSGIIVLTDIQTNTHKRTLFGTIPPWLSAVINIFASSVVQQVNNDFTRTHIIIYSYLGGFY